jgi:hypothetical protein
MTRPTCDSTFVTGVGAEKAEVAAGSTPRDLRAGVLRDGVRIAAIGIAAGAAGGYALVRVAEGAVRERAAAGRAASRPARQTAFRMLPGGAPMRPP